MPLRVSVLSIPDVLRLEPQRFDDSRGYFVETYSKRTFDLPVDTFVQDNEALSTQRGTLRGLHFQLAPSPQAKLVRVIKGSVFDVAVDLRDGSATYGRWCGATLTAAEGTQLFIPRGFAHAYCTLEPDTLFAYKVDGYYDKAAESGIRFDDPDIGIEWPISHAEIKVSEKDVALPYLRDAATPFRFGS
jgi:dTDP-4-dehydrorhamnose 3,5-epimerase